MAVRRVCVLSWWRSRENNAMCISSVYLVLHDLPPTQNFSGDYFGDWYQDHKYSRPLNVPLEHNLYTTEKDTGTLSTYLLIAFLTGRPS